MLRRIALLCCASIAVASCSDGAFPAVRAEPTGGRVSHYVVQTGQSPTNWAFFDIGDSLGEIVASSPKTFWYTLPSASDLCKIDMLGQSTCYFVFSGAFGGLSLGPDKNVWFVAGSTSVGRISPNGGVTIFSVPGQPQDTAAGPDGNVW